MINTLLQALAGYILQAFLKWAGVDNLDDLLSRAAIAIKGEIEGEEAGMETRITAQITSLPGLLGSQIQNTITGLLEPITAGITQITGLINRLPFGEIK